MIPIPGRPWSDRMTDKYTVDTILRCSSVDSRQTVPWKRVGERTDSARTVRYVNTSEVTTIRQS